jgi:hypothetical protein
MFHSDLPQIYKYTFLRKEEQDRWMDGWMVGWMDGYLLTAIG